MLSKTSLTQGAFVAVDIEATGCMPGRNGILELGAARIEGGRIVATFGELVSPGELIPYSVQALTSINDAMVADAPPIDDVFERFVRFAEGAVLIAHNYRFDLGFLDYESERLHDRTLARPILDTLALARKLLPDLGKYNLGLLASEYGVATRPNHRAPDDALATGEIFIAMLPALKAKGFTDAGEAARYCNMGGQQSLARKLVITRGLPDSPGVYLLRDGRGRVIYVGRAKSLRIRVRSYFYVNSDAARPPLGVEAAAVQHIPCPSDLDAILLQSRLINRYHPKHNVSAQRGDAATLIHVDTGSRFPAVRTTSRPHKLGRTIGPFVNHWAVETLVDELRDVYGLRRCAARLTKHAGEAACDARSDGSCPSPCVGGIDEDSYRARVEAALQVFDRSSSRMREELVARQEAAAAESRYEDAIRYRDAVKSLDRALSGFRTVKGATEHFGSIVIESCESAVALHLVRFGYLARTMRIRREDVGTPRAEQRLRRALHAAFFAGPYADDPLEFSGQQLKDLFLIATYRTQAHPYEVEVGQDEAATLAEVGSALRRLLRIPRKRHAMPSAV